MSFWAAVMLAGALLLGLAYRAGPREPRRWRWARHEIPEELDALDGYLEACESEKGVKPGLEKQIAWHDKVGETSEWVLVYFHGFTASRLELDPVPQDIAKSLKANAFYVRFAGHALDDDGHGIAKVSYADWVNDVQQALKVACKLGDKILLMSCSTGGSMATWAAQHMPQAVDALIFLSPNFKINHPLSFMLTNRWARQLMHFVEPPRRGWTGEAWWGEADWERARYVGTMEHDTPAALPVAVAALAARRAPFEEMQIPALFIVDPEDKTVKSQVTKNEVFARWAGAKRLIEMTSRHSNHHVICGNLASPENNTAVLEACQAFVADLEADRL